MDEKESNEIQDDEELDSENDNSDANISNLDNDSDFDIDNFEEEQPIPENTKDNTFDILGDEIDKSQIINFDEESDDDYDDLYYQKFNNGLTQNNLEYYHSECKIPNYIEIDKLSKVIRDENNIIVDYNHRTIPILTKYEKTRILGQRSKQLNSGSKPYINISENIIDGYIIAEMELKEKKIPFIIRRPLPNGTFEYWKVKDLEIYY